MRRGARGAKQRYLECGLHAYGFARAVCETCGDELLLPFSCKLRGICPSCNSRRLSKTAAHLVDHVIAPDLTLRQWVLTVPFGARKDVLERITHNAAGDIVDRYTTFDWAPLCEAVASLRLSLAPTAQSDSGSSGGASTR